MLENICILLLVLSLYKELLCFRHLCSQEYNKDKNMRKLCLLSKDIFVSFQTNVQFKQFLIYY